MEIKWLEDFVAVAETGNFSRAAEMRNVTQPAFSRRLKALEMWVGATLLDRSSYPITLTPAGTKFRPVAEEIIRELYASRQNIRATASVGDTTLRFAMPHSLAVGFFPFWWQSNQAISAKFKAKVIAENYHDCVEMLMNGACHILLCYRNDAVPDPLNASGCIGTPLDKDQLVLVSVPDANGSPLHTIDDAEAVAIPFLNYSPDAFLGKITASLLRQATPRLNLELRYESAFAEAVRAQTLTGAGISWLPQSLIESDMQEGRLVFAGLNAPQAVLEIWMYKSTKYASPSVSELWATAGENAGKTNNYAPPA